MGASVAALEAKTALAALLERYSSIRLASGFEPEYQQNAVLRGLKTLWVEVERHPGIKRGGLSETAVAAGCPIHSA